MRFGMVAAAAAALVCAGQAEAGRYVEFQIAGTATYSVPKYGFNDAGQEIVTYTNYARNDYVSIYADTQKPTVGGDYIFAYVSSNRISTDTVTVRYTSPSFDFIYDPSQISNTGFRDIDVTGNYGLAYCPKSGCSIIPGTQFYVRAYTIDIAPAALAIYDTFTVAPVPEPTAWAMMIAGIGAIGALLRRRSRPTRLAVS